MTWPWHTCSNRWMAMTPEERAPDGTRGARVWVSAAVAVLATLFCGAAGAAQVSGRVEIADSREASVRKHKDFSGLIVWLEPAGSGAVKPKPARVEMVQKEKRFSPHVLAIPVGSTVGFPNSDPIFHNAFSNFAGQPFDVGLYAPGTSRSVTFRRPGMVRVFCNIHPAMSAIIAVLDTPWFAVSGRSGEFRIDGVPPGEYRLRVFHERAAPQVLEGLATRVNVGPSGLELPLIRVSEAGYLPGPRKNKYGHDYPAAGEDHVLYPGAKK